MYSSLVMIFGPLSLIIWAIERAIQKYRERAARRARVLSYLRRFPESEPDQRPIPPRVLYVPKHDDEMHEADTLIPFVLSPSIFTGLETNSLPVEPEPEKFEGEGGESGGAGASGDWEESPAEPTVES